MARLEIAPQTGSAPDMKEKVRFPSLNVHASACAASVEESDRALQRPGPMFRFANEEMR
jgi:hypothetical protein